MAGNRLQMTGSIFVRLTGLLKTGAIKENEKPIWYDVYKAFPPTHEPAFARPAVDKEIKPIFYPEDVIRGKFLKVYGSVSKHNLLKPGDKSVIQKFVEKYQDIEKSRKFLTEDEVFKATEAALEHEGLSFVRRTPTKPRIEASSTEKTE